MLLRARWRAYREGGSKAKKATTSAVTYGFDGGRYWVRTSGLQCVRLLRSRCANRPMPKHSTVNARSRHWKLSIKAQQACHGCLRQDPSTPVPQRAPPLRMTQEWRAHRRSGHGTKGRARFRSGRGTGTARARFHSRRGHRSGMATRLLRMAHIRQASASNSCPAFFPAGPCNPKSTICSIAFIKRLFDNTHHG